MSIPNVEHLLEQAEQLTVSLGREVSRQVDLRRAISGAYYAVFHMVLAAAADEFVGRERRDEVAYGLAYRRIDHAALRALCIELNKPSLPPKYRRYEPVDGFGAGFRSFARYLVELQQRRISADYDPMIRLKRSDAVLALSSARSALALVRRTSPAEWRMFLALLLFPPR